MKNTGILRIQAFGARQSSPIEGVLVTVSGNGFTAQRITDETGTAADLSIEAPSCALSLQEDNTIRPYAVVDLTAAKAGFRTVRIQGVQIFAGQVTLAQPEMIPETEEDRDVVNPPIVIPEHSLFTGDGGSGPHGELRAPGAGQSHHSQKHHGASGQACGIRPQCDCLLPGLYRQCCIQRSLPYLG